MSETCPGALSNPLTVPAIQKVWPELARIVGLRIWKGLALVLPTKIEPPATAVIKLSQGYDWIADECEIPEARARIEMGLACLLHRSVTIKFQRMYALDLPPLDQPIRMGCPYCGREF